MGIGIGYGENKTIDAAKQAIQSPLLDTTIQGAKGIIFNVTGDKTLGLTDIEEAAKLIEEAADKAENPSLFKKMTGLFSSKYDKAGLLILKEEHFI